MMTLSSGSRLPTTIHFADLWLTNTATDVDVPIMEV